MNSKCPSRGVTCYAPRASLAEAVKWKCSLMWTSTKCVREHSIHAHPAQAQPIPRSVGQHHVGSSPCGKRTRSKFPVVTQWSVAGAARQFLCRSTRSAPVATMRRFDKRAFHKSGCHGRSAENTLSVCVSCDGGSRLAPPCICLQAHGLVDVRPSTSRRKSPLGFDATWTTDSTNARSTLRGSVLVTLIASSNYSTTWRSRERSFSAP